VPEATNLCLGSLVQNSVPHRRRLIDILEDGRAEYQNIQVFDFCTDTQRVTRILIFHRLEVRVNYVFGNQRTRHPCHVCW
jgi:hypothetical protein